MGLRAHQKVMKTPRGARTHGAAFTLLGTAGCFPNNGVRKSANTARTSAYATSGSRISIIWSCVFNGVGALRRSCGPAISLR
jgi:hypothetical protein